MLIRQAVLQKIRAGEITVQFRKWRRPTVKAGSTLLTSIGQLSIEAVDEVATGRITAADARRAGYSDAVELRAELEQREGDVYRIRLAYRGDDPRKELRKQVPKGRDLEELADKVRAFDTRSKSGPWALQAMELIAAQPAVRAGDLADEVGMPKPDFKARVRKLKQLGLTESLEIGYRLSPRGKAVLRALKR